MRLSNDQRAVVSVNESLFVCACPGAGKTRVAAAKVQREIGDAVATGREIICLTYTNAARDEINSRLERSLSSSWLAAVRVRTLHGFLLESVLRPWRFRSSSLARDFELAVPGSPKHEEALRSVLRDGDIGEDDLRRAVGNYWRDADGLVHVDENQSSVERFVDILERSGAIDYPGVLYHGHDLMSDEIVSNALRCATAWLIVDEYQDFNPVALGIFARLVDGERTKAFLIGDLGQMIYSFNGVTIEALCETAGRICRTNGKLEETYRCGRRISNCATRLGLGELRPTGQALDFIDNATAIRGTTVEVLSWFMTEVRKRNLQGTEVAILAPRNKQASAAAEALVSLGEKAIFFTGRGKSGSGWLIDLAACLFTGCRDFNVGAVRLLRTKLYEALDALGLTNAVYCRFDEDVWLAVLYRLRTAIDLRLPFSEIAGRTMNTFFTSLLTARMLSPADEATIKTKAREEWKRLREDSPNLLDLTGNELAELVVPTDSIRCMTIHVAKGLEFAAVALVSCEEEILPFSNYFHDPDVEAGRRQFFVALTRGEQLFVATFYGKQSRYLAEAGIPIGAGR